MLDPASIAFVHDKLTELDFTDASRDPFGDLFEIFVGSGVREEEGQFFTPQNGIDLLVSLVDPQPGERVIDPACGAGGFLGATATHLAELGATDGQVSNSVVGVEKDAYLAKLARIRLSLTTLEPSRVACGDSLAWRSVDGDFLNVEDGGYDVMLTNPPFGKKIVAASKSVQKGFHLGHKWVWDNRTCIRGQIFVSRTACLFPDRIQRRYAPIRWPLCTGLDGRDHWNTQSAHGG